MTEADRAAQRQATLKRLARKRGRSAFLRWSGVLLLLLVAHTWTSMDLRLSDFTTESRVTNLRRFVLELAPQPLQHRQWDWQIALQWFGSVVKTKGWSAGAATFAISIVAATLAALAAALLTLPATRTLATAEPFLPGARAPSLFVRGLWTTLAVGTRLFLIFLRAIPEYIWAFMLIAVIGPTAWPAILALAIHNAGILAKLYAERASKTWNLRSWRACVPSGRAVVKSPLPAFCRSCRQELCCFCSTGGRAVCEMRQCSACWV